MTVDFRELRRVDQIARENPALSAGTIRWWIARDVDRFASRCILKVGRSVYVSLPAFNAWLAEHAHQQQASA